VCALKAWPRDCLPADALEVVRAAAEAEPDDETRAAMTEIVQVLQFSHTTGLDLSA
jgi:hypothetical protein